MQYSPGSDASLIGEYVGVEICIDLRNEEDFESYTRDCERSYERRRRMRQAAAVGGRRREVREFPPPITYLGWTENLPSRMRWVMKKYYTADGRLVIREEKVRHHEYFRAHRADGRLTLQLIPLDDVDDGDGDGDGDVEDCCSVGHDVQSCKDVSVGDCGSYELKIEVENEGEGGEVEEDDDNEEMRAKLGSGDESTMAAPVMVSSVSMSAFSTTEGVNRSGGFGGGSGGLLTSASSSSLAASGGGKKCYGFNSLRSSSASSLFHLQVPAIRPVIS